MRDISILIIDDDELILETISKILSISNPNYYIGTARNVDEALVLAQKTYWDTILLDLSLPRAAGEIPDPKNGLRALHVLKKEMKLAAPLIAVTGHYDDELSDIVLDEGAYYFLHKPLRPKSLAAIVKNATSFQMSSFDGLTGLLNKKTFEERLKAEYERIKRRNQEMEQQFRDQPCPQSLKSSLSLIFMDGDNFKEINDTYNHLVGDQVLKKIGSLFIDEALYHLGSESGENYKFIIRPYDIAARFGGDEFIIFLPETSHEQALIVARRIQSLVRNYDISRLVDHGAVAPPRPELSLSIGMATYPNPNHGDSYIDLVDQADEAMYVSKRERKGEIFGYNENGEITRFD